jgi:hypothetical protein
MEATMRWIFLSWLLVGCSTAPSENGDNASLKKGQVTQDGGTTSDGGGGNGGDGGGCGGGIHDGGQQPDLLLPNFPQDAFFPPPHDGGGGDLIAYCSDGGTGCPGGGYFDAAATIPDLAW